MYGLLLLLHILGATVWTGGHLVLALTVLPRVIRERSPSELLRFEEGFEKIGMPALLIQIITGPILAYRLLPNPVHWIDPGNPVARVLMLKLGLLALTAAFAVHARFRVIPRLSEHNLRVMAWHIIPVTLFAVLFVVVGVSFRTGWFY
ncbi:CopD family protein [Marinobacterium aestuariivivens]|uniref:CopD family protein n=1 Tax=Marinobacterium aestuariivivens TaxID=1698799 RepID=A0ABW1ZSL1_9GAMM